MKFKEPNNDEESDPREKLKERFDACRKDVIQNIWEAHMHYKHYTTIRRELNECKEMYYMASVFWHSYLTAQWTASFMSLARAYDPDSKRVHSLTDLLNLVKKDPEILSYKSKRLAPLTTKELDQDCSYLDLESKGLVNRLFIHRSTVYAHTSKKAEKALEGHPLKNDDFELLLKEAGRLIDRYSILFDGVGYAMTTFQQDDYKSIIDILKNEVKARETRRLRDYEELREEMGEDIS